MSEFPAPWREVPAELLAALVAEHGECRCHSGLCYAVRGPHVACLLCMHLTYAEFCPRAGLDKKGTDHD